jgi:Ser/Thr protein kinase RdoA (MazF antagonist)
VLFVALNPAVTDPISALLSWQQLCCIARRRSPVRRSRTRVRIATTHDVDVGETEVVKRYRTWARGEPEREWQGLRLLDTYTPGVAPRPLRRFHRGDRPAVAMTRVGGTSLGGAPLDDEQATQVARALTRLHTSVPRNALDRLPRRIWDVGQALADVRRRARRRPRGLSGDVGRALAAGAAWVESADASRLREEDVRPVFGGADGNIANFLWDGVGCAVVDFEDSGTSDRAFEVADLVEHVSGSLTGAVDADVLLQHLALDGHEQRRLLPARRLMALHWLLMLLPGAPADRRNPPGSVDAQAGRLLHLLS